MHGIRLQDGERDAIDHVQSGSQSLGRGNRVGRVRGVEDNVPSEKCVGGLRKQTEEVVENGKDVRGVQECCAEGEELVSQAMRVTPWNSSCSVKKRGDG